MIYILFIIGFVLLIKGADMLVDGASAFAKKFGISSIVIGLTIVAFGTSMPELVVNLVSISNGSTDLAIGNILGSNIVNILFILGVTAAIYPIAANNNTVLKEIPFSFLAAIVLLFLASDTLIDGRTFSELSKIDGLVLLSFFSVFMYYIVTIAKSGPEEDLEIKKLNPTTSILYIVAGITGLVIGGKWIVDGAIHMANSFGMSESLIGLTIIAIGTSLPELATSVVAAMKKNTDIAIGNVVGSNIFNIFFILGVSALIKPLPFDASSSFDLIMTVLASCLLFLFMYIGKKHVLERWQGIFMIFLYVSYVIFLVMTK